ncbi:MAG TPA: ribosome biogenesis GTP-binding protein YihA/YsxC [bacterium]|nr:ribosome biogenesis GTP-binding protein YihA/YsxC [bacterium]
MRKLKSLPSELKTTSYLPEQVPALRGPLAFFLGRSNVGKSSLLNALLKRSLARVSKSPGKTRSVNLYQWGPKLTLVDVPGYGFANRSREERDSWRELMAAFFEKVPADSLGLLLMDSKRDLEEEEMGLLDSLAERGIEVEMLLTKVDRLGQSEREERRRAFGEIPLTWSFVSAKTGEGLEALRRRLLNYAKATT